MEWGVITSDSKGAGTGVEGVSVDHVFPHPSVGGGK